MSAPANHVPCFLCPCVGKVTNVVSAVTTSLSAEKVHASFEANKAKLNWSSIAGVKAGLSMRAWSFGATLGDAARAVYEVIACIATYAINTLFLIVPAKYEPKVRDFVGIRQDTASAHLNSFYKDLRGVRYSLISIGSPAKADQWYGGNL